MRVTLFTQTRTNGRSAPAPLREAAPLDVVEQVHDRLLQDLDVAQLELLPEVEARLSVEDAATRVLSEVAPGMAGVKRQVIIGEVVNEVLGLGPLQPLLDDPEITEVMVNGPSEIYYERAGVIYAATARFRDTQHIRRIADRIVAPLGRRLDDASPMVDARLPDGSRVNVVLPPIAVASPTITVRKFQLGRFDIEDLIRVGSLSEHAAEFLHSCVAAKINIVISGGTGTGKTTLLNALSSFIPEAERIVTIEDPKELRLEQQHVVALEARPAGLAGVGEISQRELVKNALRMRPDRIIVGEVRGSEAFDMMQAMNTGHEGSVTTVHANTPRDALTRIENMVLMAGFDLPARVVREQMASALQLIVQIARHVDGSRHVTALTEVVGMEGEVVLLQDVFVYEHALAGAEAGTRGELLWTGVRPAFTERFARFGMPDSLTRFQT